MPFRSSISRVPLSRALALTGLVCLGCTLAQAGEKMILSGRPTKADVPVKGPEDLKASVLQQFLTERRSALGAPDVFSFSQQHKPDAVRDKRERELLEEKRNWILNNSESLRGDKNRKSSGNSETDESGEQEKKPTTLMERLLAEQERKALGNTNQANNTFTSDLRNGDPNTRGNFGVTNRADIGPELRNRTEAAAEAKQDGASGARLPGTGRSGELPAPRASGAAPDSLSVLERSERARQQEERATQLRELLATPGTAAPAPQRGVDLLNTPDATRQDLNPTLGRSGNDFSSRLDLKRGLDSKSSSFRPSILNDLNSGGFGTPGGSVVPLLVYPEPLRMERRPAVLELPKRKI